MKELFGKYKCGEIVENSDQALFNMLEKLLSGQYILDTYTKDISIRKSQFLMSKAIKNVENILDR